ncbi:MAG TPA: hypothetical protein PLP95_06245 [Microthrixaceae bacterium]|nr:hypothetical protein [Microthrixaceae bacterium]
MSCCDATATDTVMTHRDIWFQIWVTSTDVSDHTEPIITITDSSGTVLVTSEDEGVHLDGSEEYEIPPTDFDQGRWSWWVDSSERESWPPMIDVWGKAQVAGADQTWKIGTYRVRSERAPREAGS